MNILGSRIRFDFSAPRLGIAAVAGVVFLLGALWQNALLIGCGAVLLCLVLRRVSDESSSHPGTVQRQNRRGTDEGRPDRQSEPATARNHASSASAATSPSSTGPQDTDSLVEELVSHDRYALLLRPETKQHLSQVHIVRAVRKMDEAMALVPAGRVLLGQLAEQSSVSSGAQEADPRIVQRNIITIEPVYLDRFTVTNEQFQKFVDGGGYEQLEFWHEEALPALLDFVDQTGLPGPRFWQDGQCQPGDQRLPVVGVSWYEAAAYARWVGKRLPTDAEWTKAGAWPVESSPGRIAQRRYPWGESYDVRRAHLFNSGSTGPVPVDEFPGGVSVGGVHQLIGNVWEWTATPLVELGDSSLHVSESVVSIRGGAFDTYFENQATCHYQSGEHPLSRRANIGMRLALPMSDLEVIHDDDGGDAVDELAEPAAETHSAVAAC